VDDRASMTLNFDKFTPDQHYFGLRKIHLNNSIQDPTYMNELLAGDLFRAAGVPAPRVAHAVVELNGKPFGLYVLKEGFSKEFLRQHFKHTNGNLYEMGRGHDITENPERDSGDGPDDASDLKALVAACQERNLSVRWQRLQETLDVERFVSFAVMEIFTCHSDGYCQARNNFRIYHDRDTGRMVFFPHGTDQMFQRPDWPLQAKWRGLVAQSVFQTPDGRRLYAEKCGVLYTNTFKLEVLTNRVWQVAARLKPVFDGTDNVARDVCNRLVRRAEGIEKQLNAD
jgi:spore coat protein H